MVIPNYNGKKLLEQFLPALFAFSEQNGIQTILIDDASSDDSTEFVKANFPGIKLIINENNLGFGGSCNKAIEAAVGDYIFLLNTDIQILNIDLELVENYIDLPDFFALTFKSFYPDNQQFREGAKRLKIKSGLPFVLHNEKDQLSQIDGKQVSFYPVGGHCLLNRQKFLELKGFSDLYAPFYWEDSDLGYRATKAGWQTYFDPTLTVIHDHQNSSIKSNFDKKKIRQIKLRNRIIFMYHNFTFRQRLTAFYPGMILRSLISLLSCKSDIFNAWQAAHDKIDLNELNK